MSLKRQKKIYCKYIKRALDIIFSALLLAFLLLPIFVISVAIRSESEGEIIFKQKRLGRGGRVFVCYKFRTMYKNAPHDTPSSEFCDKDRYITRTGRFLRRTSLDEIPQLLNVLKGEMSLVGPRPLISAEREMHEQRMCRGVYSLRPGITGMAQVNGRNLLCDEDKLTSDTYYLDNVRIWLDIKIIFKTAQKVIKGEGVNSKGKDMSVQ